MRGQSVALMTIHSTHRRAHTTLPGAPRLKASAYRWAHHVIHVRLFAAGAKCTPCTTYAFVTRASLRTHVTYGVSPVACTPDDVARLSPSPQHSGLDSHGVPPVLRQVQHRWCHQPYHHGRVECCTPITGCRVGIVRHAWTIGNQIILALWPLSWRLQSQPALNNVDSPPG
jgi:hypothetical protein